MVKLYLQSVVLLCCAFTISESLPTDVCTQPKKPGPCNGVITRFYYDTVTELCKSFTWGGCQANKNNFASKEDCVNLCGCSSPSRAGTCRGFFPRYYYNINLRRCIPFVYGGCHGNENNFSSLRACNQTCRTHRGQLIPYTGGYAIPGQG